MSKTAAAPYALHPLLAERWSPRAFSQRPVETQKICALLEAARWAPSCFNQQPWRFFVADRLLHAEAFERLASLLVPGNAWARQAPILILSVAQELFDLNGQPNRHAQHDVGLATAMLAIQAQALGLITHQMGGFDAEGARTLLSIPPAFTPMAMIAVGYEGSPDSLEDGLRQRELAPRERLPLQTQVFLEGWEQPYPLCFT
jgi:nitroreductase